MKINDIINEGYQYDSRVTKFADLMFSMYDRELGNKKTFFKIADRLGDREMEFGLGGSAWRDFKKDAYIVFVKKYGRLKTTQDTKDKKKSEIEAAATARERKRSERITVLFHIGHIISDECGNSFPDGDPHENIYREVKRLMQRHNLLNGSYADDELIGVYIEKALRDTHHVRSISEYCKMLYNDFALDNPESEIAQRGNPWR